MFFVQFSLYCNNSIKVYTLLNFLSLILIIGRKRNNQEQQNYARLINCLRREERMKESEKKNFSNKYQWLKISHVISVEANTRCEKKKKPNQTTSMEINAEKRNKQTEWAGGDLVQQNTNANTFTSLLESFVLDCWFFPPFSIYCLLRLYCCCFLCLFALRSSPYHSFLHGNFHFAHWDKKKGYQVIFNWLQF